MSHSILDNQNTRIETGNPGDVRVSQIPSGEWVVEGVDNNGAWVLTEPGVRYGTEAEAQEAAECLSE